MFSASHMNFFGNYYYKSAYWRLSEKWSVSCSAVSMCPCRCVFLCPWTVAHQAPLSMEFPKQAHWSG